jgi:hypothetical protein
MNAPAGGRTYRYVQSFGDPGDGHWWYSIARAGGTPLRIFLGTTTTTCQACDDRIYPIGSTCGSVPADGAVAVWTCRALGETSTCNVKDAAGEPVSCATATCAPPGHYVVTMCGAPSTGTCETIDTDGSCITVPFDYPSTSEVIGTLPP